MVVTTALNTPFVLNRLKLRDSGVEAIVKRREKHSIRK